MKRACALQPTNAAVVYICGVAQIRAGLLADGKRTFAAVLSLEPLHEGAKNAIDLCELCEKSLEAEELKKKQRLEEEEAEKEEERREEELERNFRAKTLIRPEERTLAANKSLFFTFRFDPCLENWQNTQNSRSMGSA